MQSCSVVEETLEKMDVLMRKLKKLGVRNMDTVSELEMSLHKTISEYEILSKKYCKENTMKTMKTKIAKLIDASETDG